MCGFLRKWKTNAYKAPKHGPESQISLNYSTFEKANWEDDQSIGLHAHLDCAWGGKRGGGEHAGHSAGFGKWDRGTARHCPPYSLHRIGLHGPTHGQIAPASPPNSTTTQAVSFHLAVAAGIGLVRSVGVGLCACLPGTWVLVELDA